MYFCYYWYQLMHGRRQSVLWSVWLDLLTDVTLAVFWFDRKQGVMPWEERMTSGPYTVDVLGYTCATMAITMGSKNVSLCKSYKNSLSSNCFLKLESMKEESLVIAYHYDAVNFLQLSYTQPVRRRKYVGWDTSDGFEFSVIF